MRRVAGAFAFLVAAFLVLGHANGQDLIVSGLDDDPKITPGCNPEADRLRRQYDEIKRQIKKHVADWNEARGTIRRAEMTLEDVKRYKKYPDQKPDDFDLQAEEVDANADKLKAEEDLKRIKEILLPPLVEGHGSLKEKIVALQKQCVAPPQPPPPAPAPEPAGLIDKCLVGKWKSAQGFSVYFSGHGVQILEYWDMKPFKLGDLQSITFTGYAKGRIATVDKVARLVKVEESNVKMTLVTKGAPVPVVWDLKDRLGPGGLGGTTGSNAYICTDETLTYDGSVHADRRPNFVVKLTRIKE